MEHQADSPEVVTAVATEIADALGETTNKPRRQIKQIVELCGVDFSRELFAETMQTEANGGLNLPDGSRRRTAGGVFFLLARTKISDEAHKVVFPNYSRLKPGEERKPPPPQLPLFCWEERVPLLQSLLTTAGEASTVKVTLIGRPGQVEHRKDMVVTTMSYTVKAPTLPKGVPVPPETPTNYVVYIAAKQWKRIEDNLTNPEDSLIVEGVTVYDPEIQAMAIYATNVMTKATENKRREQQKETAAVENQQNKAAHKSRLAEALAAVSNVAAPIPVAQAVTMPGVPIEIAQKLSELYASASVYRQKISTIQSKPADQQFGLEMTQKLLKNVEDEIATLEKKYAG
jgi:hypothetical protein